MPRNKCCTHVLAKWVPVRPEAESERYTVWPGAQGSGANAVRFHSCKAGCYSYDCIRSNKIIRNNLSECQLSDGKEQALKLMESKFKQKPKRAWPVPGPDSPK